jgi:hypothetical protein
MRERRGAYRALVGKPEVRRPLGKPRRRWEDNIKMDLREVGFGRGGIDWMDLAQDRDRWRTLVSYDQIFQLKFCERFFHPHASFMSCPSHPL